MTKTTTMPRTPLWTAVFAAAFSLLLAGCEMEQVRSGGESSGGSETSSTNSSSSGSQGGSSESTAPSTPAPAPAPAPTPTTPTTEPEPTKSGSFMWQPQSDSVRIVIPSSLPHWRLHVFSRRKHFTLYGPDDRGGNKAQNVEYVLSGGGASWQKKSRDVGDDGSVMVFINTRDVATGPNRNAGWRIMDPTRSQSGDGDRLKYGEDK